MRKPKLQTSIPGVGFIFKPKYTDRHGILKSSKNWTIRLTAPRTQIPTGTADQAEAFTKLMEMGAKQAAGALTIVRGTVGELLELAAADARAKRNRTYADKRWKLDWLQKVIGHIRIANFRVADLENALNRGQFRRPEQKSEPAKYLSDATKNRYRSEVRRAFRLGTEQEPPLCLKVPPLPFAKEDNVRQGFLDADDYRRFRDSFEADHARLFFVLACNTGMRKGEVLAIRWSQVDLSKRVIRLEARQCKNNSARIVPIHGDMVGYLEMAHTSRDQRCDRVIQFRGKPVGDIRTAWDTARQAAGIEIIPHDLRRTAIVNMLEAGIAEPVIMSISGHKTISTFLRYAITNERIVRRVGDKLQALYDASQYKTPVQDKTERTIN